MGVKTKYGSTDMFNDELIEGEDILWQGQPDTSKLFNRNDIALIPITVLWGGFALYWNISIWEFNAPFFFHLVGLPLLLLGIYVMFGRFFYKRWNKQNTYYATHPINWPSSPLAVISIEQPSRTHEEH